MSWQERNLLSVAYKNVVGARRASLRIIGSIKMKEEEKGTQRTKLVETYQSRVEEELNTICEDILGLLDSNLIAKASSSAEATIFYLKMKADYYRYLAEFAEGSSKKDHAGKADEAYKSATKTATGLAPTHPIRLGLALNYSVFLYEVQSKQEDACELAKAVRSPRPPRATPPRRAPIHALVRAGVRLRDRRARHARRGELQGLDPHHAAPARQPHPLDLRRQRPGVSAGPTGPSTLRSAWTHLLGAGSARRRAVPPPRE